jgi:FMN phosphatase YigB (HAD superfamily)
MRGAVLFDFGGTLDADGRRWSERFHRFYRSMGGGLSPGIFEECFNRSDRKLEALPGIVRFGLRRMVEEQVRLLRELLPDGGLIDADAWSEAFLAESRMAATRNRGILVGLGRRFTLGVLSNFCGNLRPCLAELGLEDCFEVVLDSSDLGVRKPDHRIFGLAFAGVKRPPEECWVVGDNPYADIAPAAALGCATCWLAPAERPLPVGLHPDRRIAALTELPFALA